LKIFSSSRSLTFPKSLRHTTSGRSEGGHLLIVEDARQSYQLATEILCPRCGVSVSARLLFQTNRTCHANSSTEVAGNVFDEYLRSDPNPADGFDFSFGDGELAALVSTAGTVNGRMTEHVSCHGVAL
jgi:hypothetical protein